MNIQLTFDPTKYWSGLSKNEIIRTCWSLPLWAANPFLLSTPLQQAFEAQYPFPMPPIENGTITSTGIFQYPGDPDLYPLIKLERGPETLYIYKYAIIAIVKADGSPFCSRMN